MATRCEVIMIILLVLTLLAGILMATCISIVLRKTVGDLSVKYISGKDLTVVQINSECGCGVDGLEYEFKGNRRKPTYEDFKARKTAAIKAKSEPAKGAIGEDTVYEDIPAEDVRFRFQYVNISSFPPSTNIPITRAPTTTRLTTTIGNIASTLPATTQLNTQDFVIDEEKMKSFWKKLNVPITAHVVEKRQFPKDAPHCPVPTLREYRFDEHKEKWKFNSYLVSISYQKFLDDPADLRFLCSGFIIHKEYVLTGKFCTHAKSIHLLKIRSNSAYWSKHGTLRQVIQAIYTTSLALLKVDKNFGAYPDPGKIFPIRKTEPTMDAIRSGTSAGWMVENKEKFGRYSIVRWDEECRSLDCEKPVFDGVRSCSKSFGVGDPLIDEQDALIGVRSCENTFATIGELQPLLVRFKIII